MFIVFSCQSRMNLLPNYEQATIPIEKLRDYALNIEHEEVFFYKKGRTNRTTFFRKYFNTKLSTHKNNISIQGIKTYFFKAAFVNIYSGISASN